MDRYPIVGLNVGNEYRFFYPEEIIYCKSEGNYTKVIFSDSKSIITAKKLKDLEVVLPDNIFIRVHHSYIVNLMHVSRFINDESKEIEMRNGDRVSVSRRRKSHFLSMFLKL